MAQFFEPVNFGLGAASGVLTTLAVQRVARVIRDRRNNRERAVVRTYASRESDDGYLSALVEYARYQHLLGHKIRLDEILIEPRFIPPPQLIELPEEDVPIENVFETVPLVHDYPHLHAPYNMKTLSIADLSRGTKRVVMVGTQGSGRTTALLTIALWSSGFLEFKPQRDSIIQDIEDNLDPKRDVSVSQQVLRIRRRVAMARLTENKRYEEEEDSRPIDPTEVSDDVLLEAPSIFRDIAPLYVHLADVILESGEYGRQIDPSEPLIRALQRQAGWLSSKRLVNKTYKLLENGNALVMIDGYDDILANNRPQAIRWMRALMDLYPENFFIFAMPPEGYGLLMESGAVPVYLRPWHQQDMSFSIDKIQQGWEEISKQAIEYPAADFETVEDYVQTIKPGGEHLLPLDHTLRSWSILSSTETDDMTYADRMQAYLESLMPKAGDLMPELKRMATVELDQGFITIQNLIDYATQKTVTGEDPRLTRTITAEVAAVTRTATNDSLEMVEEVTDKKKDKEDEKLEKQITSEQTKLLARLVKSGVLMQYRGGRYQFRHKILTAYLAAIDLTDVREEIVYRKYIKPDWAYAMNYLAGMRDVDFLVAEQLDNPLDVRLDKILVLTTWLKFAANDVAWRNNLLRYLGNLFASPNQFSVVRERVAAALVSSKNDSSRIVFRKGLQTKNADIRRIACYALGAMKDQAAIDALSQIVMQDSVTENKIAAQMALIAIGTEDALFAAIDLMDVTPMEEVRRAVTENLAAYHDIGYPTLHDMLESESISLRRAALYGVARASTDWSWILIDRIFQNDTESFVRLATEVVIRQKFDSYFYQLRPYPVATEVPWFIAWEQNQREYGFITYDTESEDALEMAFQQEDDASIRWLLTGTIGQLGQYDMIDKIYQSLQDNEEMIRDQAYRALAQFQERLGTPIPLPIQQ
ncbi:MAG: HEAT repeat domain-containing protein [Phototrophicaceae bacterium]